MTEPHHRSKFDMRLPSIFLLLFDLRSMDTVWAYALFILKYSHVKLSFYQSITFHKLCTDVQMIWLTFHSVIADFNSPRLHNVFVLSVSLILSRSFCWMLLNILNYIVFNIRKLLVRWQLSVYIWLAKDRRNGS